MESDSGTRDAPNNKVTTEKKEKKVKLSKAMILFSLI